LVCHQKELAVAYGKIEGDKFLVRAGSTAMRNGAANVKRYRSLRDDLVSSGVLVPDDDPQLFLFAKDYLFESKSAAAGVVIDGNSNGSQWRDDTQVDFAKHEALLRLLTLKEVEEAMAECDRIGTEAFLEKGHFTRPKVWFKATDRTSTYPAKATVVAAIALLPNGLKLSAKEFFNGFGEAQVSTKLRELGYEIVRNGLASVNEGWTREDVEAAMDAYDAYTHSGENADIFEEFRSPRDFWVRSSRRRSNRVYPSKPIHYWLNRNKANSGGWAEPTYSAAVLHNIGFVIVDKNDKPVTPPDKSFLLSGADRIRLCALNYFIEPAREQQAISVSIRAGDLAWDLGLKDALPNICQALGGEKFQLLANVSEPTYTEPNPSSSTVFTYEILSENETNPVASTSKIETPAATNLIFYGPPGTGKTYSTAWEAVRLCLGDVNAEQFKSHQNRQKLMAEYRRLNNEGRIEFVTFHQSISYEEFVEGLRPSTGDAGSEKLEEGEQNSTGFSLITHDGVFKRISERAKLDALPNDKSPRLDRSKQLFKVALGQRGTDNNKIQFGLDENIIHVGWGGDVDWSDQRFENYDEILAEWREKKDENVSGLSGQVVVTYSFRADMQIGDYVVISDGRDRIQALGVVVGDYYYEKNADFHPHRRKVEWLWRDPSGADRNLFYTKPFRRHSVYKLDYTEVNWDGLEEIAFGRDVFLAKDTARDFVLIIDEINRANISKVFGELITLLEPDKRLGMANEIRLTLPYSKKKFGVPPNLHIIGTMNTADRSIALLDTALRRRFIFRELMPDASTLPQDLDGINVQKLLTVLNDRIEYLFDREHQIGHAYFTGCKSRADLGAVMRYKVIPLLAEYFYEDWSKVAAVLGDSRQDQPRFLVREEIESSTWDVGRCILGTTSPLASQK